jgi:hypothetical protein
LARSTPGSIEIAATRYLALLTIFERSRFPVAPTVEKLARSTDLPTPGGRVQREICAAIVRGVEHLLSSGQMQNYEPASQDSESHLNAARQSFSQICDLPQDTEQASKVAIEVLKKFPTIIGYLRSTDFGVFLESPPIARLAAEYLINVTAFEMLVPNHDTSLEIEAKLFPLWLSISAKGIGGPTLSIDAATVLDNPLHIHGPHWQLARREIRRTVKDTSRITIDTATNEAVARSKRQLTPGNLRRKVVRVLEDRTEETKGSFVRVAQLSSPQNIDLVAAAVGALLKDPLSRLAFVTAKAQPELDDRSVI